MTQCHRTMQKKNEMQAASCHCLFEVAQTKLDICISIRDTRSGVVARQDELTNCRCDHLPGGLLLWAAGRKQLPVLCLGWPSSSADSEMRASATAGQ